MSRHARQSVAELSKDIDFSNHPGPPSGDVSYFALINMTATIRIAFLLALVLFATTARGDRPNILFILADDQSPFDLKMYNPASTIDTPVLEQSAAKEWCLTGRITWALGRVRCAHRRGT